MKALIPEHIYKKIFDSIEWIDAYGKDIITQECNINTSMLYNYMSIEAFGNATRVIRKIDDRYAGPYTEVLKAASNITCIAIVNGEQVETDFDNRYFDSYYLLN